MDNNQFLLVLVKAGISLLIGLSSMAAGFLNSKARDYLVFGLMNLLLAAFFIVPAISSVSQAADQELMESIFLYAYFALIPLYFISRTNRWKIWQVISITAIMLVLLAGVIFSFINQATSLFYSISLIMFVALLITGRLTDIWLVKDGRKKDSAFTLSSLALITVLTGLTFYYLFSSSGMESFILPLMTCALGIDIIIGFRMIEQIYQVFESDKERHMRDSNWMKVMQTIPLIAVEIDYSGNILLMNEFGRELLGHSSNENLKGKNWVQEFVPEKDRDTVTNLIHAIRENNKKELTGKSLVSTRNHQMLRVKWHYYPLQSLHERSILLVGKDVTEEENRDALLEKYTMELEKHQFPTCSTIPLSDDLVCESQEFKYVLSKVKTVSQTVVPVLIEGETGVGKEEVADLIYKNSLRNGRPFIKVNCGALPRDLVEDELFGHEKGAFTSAVSSRKGRFELAHGGTIFLDEIGELPIDMQPKLLRVLQNGQFERVGGQATLKVDVRIIAATNRNLRTEVQEGRFREDLFYRLNVFPVTIPPLRKRTDDLNALISFFISTLSKQYKKHVTDISKGDLKRLMEYSWPGNVRELKNVIERSVLSSEGTTLHLDWFNSVREENNKPMGESRSLLDIEKEHILKILDECSWKINGESGAAEKLEMHPNTLRSKMKKLRISRPARMIG